jgi:hypothetical protein
MQTYAPEIIGPDRERQEQTTDDLTIGRLAVLTGVSAKAIRYYEEIALLPRPPRGANRYRRYGPADLTLRRDYSPAGSRFIPAGNPASPRRRCPRH